MKKTTIFTALILVATLFMCAPVEARHHHHHRHGCRSSFGVSFGAFAPMYAPTVYAAPPVYVAPYVAPPVYARPPVYSYPTPYPQTVYVVQQPRPVYVQPNFSFGWSFFR